MACTPDTNMVPDPTDSEYSGRDSNSTTSNRLVIRIGSRSLTATLLDNATVRALKARLPMTGSMSELNGNEKLYRFADNLPTHASNPRTIHTGDLMLDGSNSLVLFYETFPTSYSYTSLGRIDNPSGLAATLSSGEVTVTFEVDKTK